MEYRYELSASNVENLYQEVVIESRVNPRGERLDTCMLGVKINDQLTVPFTQMESFELNAEEVSEATELWFDYDGKSYAVALPDQDSPLFEEIMELVDPM